MREEGLVHAETTFPASLTLITAVLLLAIGVAASQAWLSRGAIRIKRSTETAGLRRAPFRSVSGATAKELKIDKRSKEMPKSANRISSSFGETISDIGTSAITAKA